MGNHVVRKAKDDPRIGDPRVEAIAEPSTSESADLRRVVIIAVLEAVAFWADVLRDRSPASTIRKDKIGNDGLRDPLLRDPKLFTAMVGALPPGPNMHHLHPSERQPWLCLSL